MKKDVLKSRFEILEKLFEERKSCKNYLEEHKEKVVFFSGEYSKLENKIFDILKEECINIVSGTGLTWCGDDQRNPVSKALSELCAEVDSNIETRGKHFTGNAVTRTYFPKSIEDDIISEVISLEEKGLPIKTCVIASNLHKKYPDRSFAHIQSKVATDLRNHLGYENTGSNRKPVWVLKHSNISFG